MEELKIRSATINDRDFIFDVVNSDAVREMSFSSHQITYTEHCSWYNNVLKSDAIFFVGVVENSSIGYVRFETVPGVEGCVLSVAIADAWRGKKLGSLFVNMCCLKAFDAGIDKIVAIVKPKNLPSVHLFERCGFCNHGIISYKGNEAMLFYKNRVCQP